MAVLVSLIALIGVAQVGSQALTYEQHGYLRLQRYANDALEVMRLNNSLENIIDYVILGENAHGGENYQIAENIARENLRAILPEEVQFRFTIGWDRPYLWNPHPHYRFGPVYPTIDSKWEERFENAKERATAVRLTPKFFIENIRVLAWVEPELNSPLLENFINNVKKPAWKLKKVNDEASFRNEIDSWNPDVIFIPDAKNFDDETLDDINDYLHFENAGIVAGGKTLYNNWDLALEDAIFWWSFGVKYPLDLFPPRSLPVPQSGLENVHITDRTHYVSAMSPEWVEYDNSENVYKYDYPPFFLSEDLVDNLGQWELEDENWPDVIIRYPTTWFTIDFGPWTDIQVGWHGRSVLFSGHPAQSAIYGEGKKEWITLAQRAIQWAARKEPEFEPITLHIWRKSGS